MVCGSSAKDRVEAIGDPGGFNDLPSLLADQSQELGVDHGERFVGGPERPEIPLALPHYSEVVSRTTFHYVHEHNRGFYGRCGRGIQRMRL